MTGTCVGQAKPRLTRAVTRQPDQLQWAELDTHQGDLPFEEVPHFDGFALGDGNSSVMPTIWTSTSA